MVLLPKPQPQAVTVPVEVEEELTNLRGFRDLVGERWGYWLGRKLTQHEMNEKTAEPRKKAREIRKGITDNLEKFITESDIDGYHEKMGELKEAKKVVKEAQEPFRKKINPLGRAVRFLDTVAIPDALKELGTPVQPRFSLSDFVKQALESAKK